MFPASEIVIDIMASSAAWVVEEFPVMGISRGVIAEFGGIEEGEWIKFFSVITDSLNNS